MDALLVFDMPQFLATVVIGIRTVGLKVCNDVLVIEDFDSLTRN